MILRYLIIIENVRAILFVFLITAFLISSAQNNLQNYTPSVLLDKGDWKFKTFQNFYTQTKYFSTNGGKKTDGVRQNFFTSINQFLYGANHAINIGLDVWVKYSSNSIDSIRSQTGITGLGPKIKIAPLKSVPRLSLQSTLLFNLTDRSEGSFQDNLFFLETDATLWLNQIFYDFSLNDKSQLFFQQVFWYRFVKDGSFAANDFLQTQTSIFYSYFATPRWTVYGLTEYFPTHYNPDDNVEKAAAFFSYFVQSGIGTKYQLVPNLIELEFLYTNFWLGSKGQGAGDTINFGVRLIHQ